jgi:hypothetical protein
VQSTALPDVSGLNEQPRAKKSRSAEAQKARSTKPGKPGVPEPENEKARKSGRDETGVSS